MMEIVLALVVIALALVLTGVCVIAYRKSHLHAALYLVVAFLLFAIKKAIELAHLAARIEQDVSVIVSLLEVTMLLFFILALWRR